MRIKLTLMVLFLIHLTCFQFRIASDAVLLINKTEKHIVMKHPDVLLLKFCTFLHNMNSIPTKHVETVRMIKY